MFLSVLIDTYNHERFIERAISSVLDQDFPAGQREIIVLDDGSMDRTPELVRQFEPRLRLIRKRNGGQASAFNAGIPECRGDILVFLDGDDWWAKGKLRRISQVFSEYSSLGMVGHAFIESFADGSERVIAPGKLQFLRLNTSVSANIFRLSRCYFGTSRLALSATLARKLLPIPEALIFEADEYLFTAAAGLAECAILPDPLTHYRIHTGNLYLAAGASSEGERRKQRVLESLTEALRTTLPALGTPTQAVVPLLELLQSEATQLRLKLDGGWPLETFRTENNIYRIQHADAGWKSRAFRALSMLPALVLPPRWFYSGRQWLASQLWYRRIRESYIPVPGFTKIDASPHDGPL